MDSGPNESTPCLENSIRKKAENLAKKTVLRQEFLNLSLIGIIIILTVFMLVISFQQSFILLPKKSTLPSENTMKLKKIYIRNYHIVL